MLLVNAAASSVTARRRVIIAKLFSADHDIHVAETAHRGHATEIAATAAAEGFGAIVVLGGDGTLNEVANGLVNTNCAVAALPGGSTNVFARTIGLSDEPVDAALMINDALVEGRVSPMGVGSVNGRYFMFHTGIGWDAVLVSEVEKRSELKRYASHPLFIWCGLKTWFARYDRKHPHFRVTNQDGSVDERGFFTVVLNTNPYTYVGARPFNLTPNAGLDRPLSSVTVTKMSSIAFLRLMSNSLTSDDAAMHSPIVSYKGDVESLVIEGLQGPVPYQVDGDYAGEAQRLEFRYHPSALQLVLPPTMTGTLGHG